MSENALRAALDELEDWKTADDIAREYDRLGGAS